MRAAALLAVFLCGCWASEPRDALDVLDDYGPPCATAGDPRGEGAWFYAGRITPGGPEVAETCDPRLFPVVVRFHDGVPDRVTWAESPFYGMSRLEDICSTSPTARCQAP